MSLTSKFDKFKTSEDSASEQTTEDTKDIERFDSPGHARNICFVETSGKQTFLNYSYVISGEFLPEENIITLYFTTHCVTLKGAKLVSVFESLKDHSIKMIRCIDKRYLEIEVPNNLPGIITEMKIVPTKD